MSVLDGDVTVIVNGARDAVSVPSLTVILILENVPTFEVAGVPLIRPVVVEKVAQLGRFDTEKLSVVPAEPLAVGVKA